MRRSTLLCLATAAALFASAARAHHSAARFDPGRTITVEGVVTRIEWANPHVYIYVEQTADSGRRIEWELETNPISIMRRMGWSRDTLRAGDAVTVTGNPARNADDKSLLPTSISRGGTTLYDTKKGFAALASAGGPPQVAPKSLNGTWVTLLALPLIQQVIDPAGTLQLTDEGAAAVKGFDEATMNPAIRCVPYPAPMFMIDPDIKQITAGDGVIRIGGEQESAQRIVHMNVTTHDGAAPSVQGHSIGRWEGGTLVIDTARFAAHRSGNAIGLPSGPRKHLLERLTPNPDGKTLTYHFELKDPEFLAAPVTGDAQWAYRPDVKFAPVACDPANARRFTRHFTRR